MPDPDPASSLKSFLPNDDIYRYLENAIKLVNDDSTLRGYVEHHRNEHGTEQKFIGDVTNYCKGVLGPAATYMPSTRFGI